MHPHGLGKRLYTKTDLAIYGPVLSVSRLSIMYRQKMDFSSCAQMVGFPKSSHKCESLGKYILYYFGHEIFQCQIKKGQDLS